VGVGDRETGILAALVAAFLWTISSLFWNRVRMSAVALNFIKCALGSLMLLVHLVVLAWFNGQPVFQANGFAWHMLAWGGIFGIAIGDYCYFRSLQIVGPRKCFLLTTTTPIFAIALMWLLFGQKLTLVVFWGILMIMSGVGLVVMERRTAFEIPSLMPGQAWVGVWLGLASAVCQALGGMFSQQAMENSECSPGEAAFIRLLVGAVIMLAVVVGQGEFSKIRRELLTGQHLKLVICGTALGTWLGIWMSQVAYQKTDLALASTLLTTSPLFAIPVMYLYYGQRTTALAWAGSLIAVVGVAIALNPDAVLFLYSNLMPKS
jgi:drug/metabolite transporter (DMT)-like permease